jgi:hypothetical protein
MPDVIYDCLRNAEDTRMTPEHILHPMLQDFAASLGRDVRVDVPHGASRPPQTTTSEVQVFFWSRPSGAHWEEGQGALSRLFGVMLASGQRDRLSPSEGSDIILYDEAGNAAAQIEGSTLYILFDLAHTPSPVEPERLMGIILDWALPLMAPGAVAVAPGEDLSRRLAQAMSSLNPRRLDEAKSHLDDARNHVATRQRDLANAIRQEQMHLATWKALEAAGQVNYEAKARQEMEALQVVVGDHPITIRSGIVHVELGDVSIPNPDFSGDIVYIGKFRAELHLSNADIRLYNMGGREDGVGGAKDGYQHPHIPRDGRPCLGNIHEQVVSLMANLQLATLVGLLKDYLGSYNAPGAYVRLRRWGDTESATPPPTAVSPLPMETPVAARPVSSTVDGDRYCRDCGELDCTCEICPDCGIRAHSDFTNDTCQCLRCSECDDLDRLCECDKCPDCGRSIYSCDVPVCEQCERHESNCICSTCDTCGYRLTECHCAPCPTCDEPLGRCEYAHCEECGHHEDRCECVEEDVPAPTISPIGGWR